MSCRELVEFLADYVEGALPAEARNEFHRHLDDCPECIDYLNSYRQTVALGRDALTCPDDDAVPGDVPEELVQAILAARRSASA